MNMTPRQRVDFFELVQKLTHMQLHAAAQICLYYYPDKFEDSFLRGLIWSTVINNNNIANLIYQINEISKKSDEELAAEEYKKRRIDPSGKSVLSYLLLLDKETIFRVMKRAGKNILLSKATSFKEAIEYVGTIAEDPVIIKLSKELNPEPDTAEAWEFVTPNTQ